MISWELSTPNPNNKSCTDIWAGFGSFSSPNLTIIINATIAIPEERKDWSSRVMLTNLLYQEKIILEKLRPRAPLSRPPEIRKEETDDIIGARKAVSLLIGSSTQISLSRTTQQEQLCMKTQSKVLRGSIYTTVRFQ